MTDPIDELTITVPVETTREGEGPSGFRYTISKKEAVRLVELGAMCSVKGGDIKSIIVRTNNSGVWLSGPEGSITEIETHPGVEPYEGEGNLRADLEIDSYCVYLTAREKHSDQIDCYKSLVSLTDLIKKFGLAQEPPAKAFDRVAAVLAPDHASSEAPSDVPAPAPSGTAPRARVRP